MVVRQLHADDWALYREIRLAALSTDPGAFASSHEREVGFDEARWRGRLTTGPDGRPSATFIDTGPGPESGTRPLGTVGVAYTEYHPAPMLVAMWVRPDARGRGSGRRLIDAVVAWAAERDESAVVLWVVKDNHAAVRLYESCGFEATGNVDTLPSNPCADEREMIRAIRSTDE